MHFTDTHYRERDFIASFPWHLLNAYYVPDSTGSWQLKFIVAEEACEKQSYAATLCPCVSQKKATPPSAPSLEDSMASERSPLSWKSQF